MNSRDFEELLEKYDNSAKAFPELKSAAEKRVVEWKRSYEERREWIPFWNDANLIDASNFATPSRHQWLQPDAIDSPDEECYAHGFDAEGRLLVIRENDGKYEVYFRYEEDFIDETRFYLDDSEVERHYFIRYELNGKVATRQHHVSDGEITTYLWEFPSATNAKLRTMTTSYSEPYAIECNEDGRIARAFRPWATQQRLVYVMPDSRDFESVARDLEDAIVESTPAIVRACKPKEPIWAIMINYCGSDPYQACLGGLRVVELSARELIAEDEGIESIWRTDNYEYFEGSPELDNDLPDSTSVREKELRFMYTLLESGPDEAFRQQNWRDSIRDMARQAARRLNDIDWSAICRVSSDFVVVALDYPGDLDWKDDIEASVTPEQFKVLSDNGLLDEDCE